MAEIRYFRGEKEQERIHGMLESTHVPSHILDRHSGPLAMTWIFEDVKWWVYLRKDKNYYLVRHNDNDVAEISDLEDIIFCDKAELE